MSTAWRSIESAPTDGWLLLGDAERQRVILGCWNEGDVDDLVGYPARWEDTGGFPQTATHWMPLPAPPCSDDARREPTEGELSESSSDAARTTGAQADARTYTADEVRELIAEALLACADMTSAAAADKARAWLEWFNGR